VRVGRKNRGEGGVRGSTAQGFEKGTGGPMENRGGKTGSVCWKRQRAVKQFGQKRGSYFWGSGKDIVLVLRN